jgi:hypothetical protein
LEVEKIKGTGSLPEKTQFIENQIGAILGKVELGAKVGQTCRKRCVCEAKHETIHELAPAEILAFKLLNSRDLLGVGRLLMVS